MYTEVHFEPEGTRNPELFLTGAEIVMADCREHRYDAHTGTWYYVLQDFFGNNLPPGQVQAVKFVRLVHPSMPARLPSGAYVSPDGLITALVLKRESPEGQLIDVTGPTLSEVQDWYIKVLLREAGPALAGLIGERSNS